MPGIEDLLPGANGGAYEKREIRTGPPLEYVMEKMHSSLWQLHGTYQAAVDSEAGIETGGSETLSAKIHAGFYYELVAFLALLNMLALTDEHDLAKRLLSLKPKEFDAWLKRVETEGATAG